MDKCCCCIPLRGGVFAIALLTLLANIAEIAYLFLRRDYFTQHFQGSSNSFVAVFWVMVTAAILYAVASLFGVIGSSLAKRAMVLIFSTVNWIFVIFTLLVYTALWIYIMVKKGEITDACTKTLDGAVGSTVNGTAPNSVYTPLFGPAAASVTSTDACNETIKWVSIYLGIVVLVGGLISVYFASAVSAYSTRLKRFNNHTKLQDMDEMSYAPRKSLAGAYNAPY
jgi:hypothetical protein